MAQVLIEVNRSVREFNTFGVDVLAAEFARISSVDELLDVLQRSERLPWILGGGSNLLLTADVDRLVLRNEIKGIDIVREDDDWVWIRVGGGEIWHELVMWAVNKDFGGIENLALIPGSVGAAPIQNIGAYGTELSDCFVSLEAVKLSTGEKETFDSDRCAFGYRESVFKHELKGQYLISSVSLKLSKRNHDLRLSYGAIGTELQNLGHDTYGISDVCNAVIAIRSSKLPDPSVLGNSGSFFKNPIVNSGTYHALLADFPDIPAYQAHDSYKVPAGWLIEQCGWKGKRVGSVGCYSKQALVIVNYGGASGAEIYAHAMNVRQSVLQKFGIELTPEVNIL